MIRFSLIPFRLGGAASKPLSDDALRCYAQLVEIFGEDDVAVFGGEPGRVHTWTTEQVVENPVGVAMELADALQASEADIVNVLDLTTPDAYQIPQVDLIRGAVYLPLFDAIVQHLSRRNGVESGLQLLVLLPEVPPAADVAALMASAVIESGQLALVDPQGGVRSKRRDIPSERVASAIALARLDRFALLKAKMIVRRGWFLHQGEEDEFVRYHYDGSLCQRELQSLIAEFLSVEAPDLILFDTPVTDWLESPLRAAGTDAGVLVEPLALVANAVETLVSSGIGAPDCLVVVPMVDSGRSLREILSQLSTDPRLRLKPPLAVLSTAGTAPELGTRTLEDGHGRPVGEARYILRVPQVRVAHADLLCDPIHLGIPASSRTRENQLGLTTYEFWDLVAECGWKPEDDVPTWRPSSGMVPNLAVAIERYGAWLASKLAEIVRRDIRLLPQDTLFVAPAERASLLLGERLELAVGAHVVHIPRDVIDRLVDRSDLTPNEIADIADSDQRPWRRHLRSATTDTVVVFDEFISSGGTVAALVRLLQAMRLSVVCVATLVDFRPGLDRFGMPVRSLYGWERPEKQ